MRAVMSAWYGAIWPQPDAPSAVVTRTSPTNWLLKDSIDTIRSASFEATVISKHDHTAHAFATPGGIESLVDPVQGKPARHQLVELQPSGLVLLDHRGKVGSWTYRSHLAAQYAHGGVGELSRVKRDGDASRGDAHDDNSAPAPRKRQAERDGGRTARRDERVVGSAATGELADRRSRVGP